MILVLRKLLYMLLFLTSLAAHGIMGSSQSQPFNTIYRPDINEILRHDSAFVLGERGLDRLKADVTSPLMSGLSREQQIECLRQGISKRNHQPYSAELFASEVHFLSRLLKMDPFYVAGKLDVESKFKNDSVSPTGAAGASQLTEIGIKEILQQLQVLPSNATEEVAEEIDYLLRWYFFLTDTRTSYAEWEQWLRDTPQGRDETLRRNLAISIAGGGVLLKVYLAVNNNNYRKALIQYNGDEKIVFKDGKRIMTKIWYAEQVEKAAERFVEECELSNEYVPTVMHKSPLDLLLKVANLKRKPHPFIDQEA